ncbi:MAG: serpin family protein [Phycisphaerae bacterium]|nr:serpin family protein [Phycisphaerae bacterium]
MSTRRSPVVTFFGLTVAFCGCSAAVTAEPPGKLVKADVPRAAPEVGRPALQELAQGNTAFGLELYAQVRGQPGNLAVSPLSISVALAMTYAGARGETATQMQRTLHLPAEDPHAAMNTLVQRLLATPPGVEPGDPRPKPPRLDIVNQLFAQEGDSFEAPFLESLARDYGAGVRLLDFRQADAAAQAINDWISQRTEKRIQNLVSPADVRAASLTLANAIYFKAKWNLPFAKGATRAQPFKPLDGSEVSVPTMSQTATFRHAAGDAVQAVELLYARSSLAMLLLVPDAGQFTSFEQRLTPNAIQSLVDQLKQKALRLSVPKWTVRAKFRLNDALSTLGMPAAFDPACADFTGMSPQNLWIGAALHEAFVRVDEEGTEAAAATALPEAKSEEPRGVLELKIDRPFLFVIRDTQTGTILFLGRVVDPRG